MWDILGSKLTFSTVGSTGQGYFGSRRGVSATGQASGCYAEQKNASDALSHLAQEVESHIYNQSDILSHLITPQKYKEAKRVYH